jgi:hypothetical protein
VAALALRLLEEVDAASSGPEAARKPSQNLGGRCPSPGHPDR